MCDCNDYCAELTENEISSIAFISNENFEVKQIRSWAIKNKITHSALFKILSNI